MVFSGVVNSGCSSNMTPSNNCPIVIVIIIIIIIELARTNWAISYNFYYTSLLR